MATHVNGLPFVRDSGDVALAALKEQLDNGDDSKVHWCLFVANF